MKQTAIQKAIEDINGYRSFGEQIDILFVCRLLEKVYLETEKQQIIDAVNQKQFDDIDGLGISDTITKGEQYYNETYGSKGSDETLKEYHIVDSNEMVSSQTEISDEEIEEMLFHHSNEYAYGFKDAIQWYREQLKQKQ
jgi:hypothetical protein